MRMFKPRKDSCFTVDLYRGPQTSWHEVVAQYMRSTLQLRACKTAIYVLNPAALAKRGKHGKFSGDLLERFRQRV
jgi:hypothetical protein